MPKVLRVEAEQNLMALIADRERTCRMLEEESAVFVSTPYSEKQHRQFNLIYKLLQDQVRERVSRGTGERERERERGTKAKHSKKLRLYTTTTTTTYHDFCTIKTNTTLLQ